MLKLCLRLSLVFAVLTSLPLFAAPPIEIANAPAGGEYGGHGDPRHTDRNWRAYHIWNDNCHTAANGFVRATAPNEKRGILVCKGNPEKSEAFHTANWAVIEDGKSCIFNWGRKCCWDARANPPDVKNGDGLACAKWACGKQWEEKQTHVMPEGQLVEMPGVLACIREAGGAKDLTGTTLPKKMEGWQRGGCLSCCDRRTETWKGSEHGWAKREEFFKGCRAKCYAIFTDPWSAKTPPFPDDNAAQRTGRACYSAEWKNTDKCKKCCDSASDKRFAPSDLGQCKARCEKQ